MTSRSRQDALAAASNSGNHNGKAWTKGHVHPEIDPPPARRVRRLERAIDRLPLLRELGETREWKNVQPLAGVSGHFLLHFLANAVAFLELAKGLGLDPRNSTVFYKGGGYRYIEPDAVKSHLRWMGFTVRPAEDITPDYVRQVHERAVSNGTKNLFVEDGGKFGPILAKHSEYATNAIGISEQTSRGERVTGEAKPLITLPVMSIAKAKLKKPEAVYVADGAVSALKVLVPHNSIKHMKTAVLGLGDIGRATMLALAENCAPAVGYDPDAENQVGGKPLCGSVAAFAIDAVRDADAIFGCSGYTSLDASLIPHLKHGVYLISESSDDVEFDKGALNRLGSPSPMYRAGCPRTERNRIGTQYVMHGTGKVIRLIGDGYPINLFAAEFGGMGDAQADCTMSLLFLSMAALAMGKYANRTGVLSGEIDKLAQEHRIAERYLAYHR